jgi:hypothetical protein
VILRRENDLAVLRIRLDRRSVGGPGKRLGPAVVFELVVGTGDALELARVPPGELGVPEQGLSGVRHELPITLPAGLVGHPAIGAALADRSALWLELPAPSGPLRPLAWEAALAQLPVPVLRLPYFALRPVPTDGPCTIAICASSPAAKGRIDIADGVQRFLEVIRDQLGWATRVHVFTDAEWSWELSDGDGVTVHDPRRAADYALPRRSTAVSDTSTVDNPWLRWMHDELAGSAVDHVHFLCHGFLAADGGAVALAPSPTDNSDRRISRFVGAGETVALLTALGAWSVGFTGPDGNYSELGLRALADAVAEGRPGPVLAHETTGDERFTELGAALAVAIGVPPDPVPRWRRTALWIHPQRVQPSASSSGRPASGAALLDESSSTSLLLGEQTTRALAATQTPSWVASSARILEQAQASWLSPTQAGVGEGASDPAWREQAESALRLAAELLEAHVRQSGGQS